MDFLEAGEAHHPPDNGRSIGTIYLRYSNEVGLALVKLNDKETFVNQLFETAEGKDRCKLAVLTPFTNLRQCDPVFMINPFMGSCCGQTLPKAYGPRSLSIPGEPQQNWIPAGHWVRNGQGSSEEMQDSIRGTPLTDEEDGVVGFFRFAGKGGYDDYCFATGAQNLINKGYKLCQDCE